MALLAPCVLVVEDEVLIQIMLQTDLSESGFTVVLDKGADEAIKRLDMDASRYQALVTDINLNGDRSGWDVARHARELNPDLPVVYMTGDSAHEWAVYGVPNSILVCKPFASAQIVSAVAQLLNSTMTAPH